MLESERFELSELKKDFRETAEAGRELIDVLRTLDLVVDLSLVGKERLQGETTAKISKRKAA